MKLLAAVLLPGLLAFAPGMVPSVSDQEPQIVIRGYVVAPDKFELFGNGKKEFELSSSPEGWGQGDSFTLMLCFDRESIYREVERNSGMAVEVRGRVVERGYREWLLVEGVELLK